MLGPILLPPEAQNLRQQLAKWASAERARGEDFAVDCHDNRLYEISKIRSMVEPLLRILNLEVRYEKSDEESY